jgi:hypothetical protein
MNPFIIPKPYREALACYEAFHKLGFKTDDIYFCSSQKGSQQQIAIQLIIEEKIFTVIAGFVPDDNATIETTWKDLAKAVNTDKITQEHLNKLWQQSKVFQDKDNFIRDIKGKGIKIPIEAN